MKGKCNGLILLRIRRDVHELNGRFVSYNFNEIVMLLCRQVLNWKQLKNIFKKFLQTDYV